jgi:hypothetical protein
MSVIEPIERSEMGGRRGCVPSRARWDEEGDE